MNSTVTRRAVDGLRQGDRGWVMNPLDAAGPAPFSRDAAHLVSIRPGASRGNHLHQNATERILVFGGPGVLAWRRPGEEEAREFAISGDVPELFEVPPGVEHVIANTSRHDIYALVFYDQAPETSPASRLLPSRKGERT